ncbi:MAG: hypothetical protein LC775_11970, partial [Acidobacteria bacterium]|nr:hypothetical protein [Acidobacteriota bacterium]
MVAYGGQHIHEPIDRALLDPATDFIVSGDKTAAPSQTPTKVSRSSTPVRRYGESLRSNDRRAEVVRYPGILRAGNKSSLASPRSNGTVRRRAAPLELVSLSGA